MKIIKRSLIQRLAFENMSHHLLMHLETVVPMHRISWPIVLFEPGSTRICCPRSCANVLWLCSSLLNSLEAFLSIHIFSFIFQSLWVVILELWLSEILLNTYIWCSSFYFIIKNNGTRGAILNNNRRRSRWRTRYQSHWLNNVNKVIDFRSEFSIESV